MSTERITEKLTKVAIGMIEDGHSGTLSLNELLHSVPELETSDLEQLYVNCKTASEITTKLSESFTKQVTVTFEQHERFTGTAYVPDCRFIIVWAS